MTKKTPIPAANKTVQAVNKNTQATQAEAAPNQQEKAAAKQAPLKAEKANKTTKPAARPKATQKSEIKPQNKAKPVKTAAKLTEASKPEPQASLNVLNAQAASDKTPVDDKIISLSASLSTMPEGKTPSAEKKPDSIQSAPDKAEAKAVEALIAHPEKEIKAATNKAPVKGEVLSSTLPLSVTTLAKDKTQGSGGKPDAVQPAADPSESKAVEAVIAQSEAASQVEPNVELAEQDLPSETKFVASQPPLPAFEMKPESLSEDFQINPGLDSPLSDIAETIQSSPVEAEIVQEPVSEPEFVSEDQSEAMPSLFIVQITPELAPVAKVGGLADVVFGLSNELEIRGNHVETILPKYDCLRYDQIWGMCETYGDLWVPWYGGAIHCTVYFGFVHGRKCFFIEPHSADNFFNRGSIYGFNDDVLRFAFFSRAAMEFLWKSGKQPDIIHCHDWQTALVPVFLYEIYQHLGMTHPRVCFTIHNFKHQGATGTQLLQASGLNRPEYYYHYDRLRDNVHPHALNLTKAGVVYSNFITTVSPRHALEAKDQGQGFGLEPTLHIHHAKFGGVVNGIDYSFWNTEYDPHIPFKYNVDELDNKYLNKKALRDRLLLADCEKPIVAFVGRLDPQKGLELIRHALYYTLQQGGQFVLLGSSPDGQINQYFWSLKNQFNDNPHCHIEIGFNEELSHLIYAGADMMIVPSRFEPCGLTQLISMRYGTISIVREIGGLADTVFDKDYSHKPLNERNGYVFKDYDEKGLEFALGRAISCYYEFPDHFRELIKNAMRYDFSWKNPGKDYLNIYHYIRNK